MVALDISGRYTLREEVANSITHGLGVVLSIAGLAVLTGLAGRYGDAWHIVSCSIFGSTLILLYTASTLYHGIPHPGAKKILRIVDHCAIFLLIAGTYTPFTLVNLRGPWGWSLFGAIWGLALLGIILQLTPWRRFRVLSVLLYVGMGWAVVVATNPLLNAVHPNGLLLLALGGLAYTGGIVFYAWRRLPHHHAIWHLFVLTGSVLHFFAVLLYVIPFSA
ncbi:hemolysin III [Desulfonatronum thiosulfatophilum]|uniref:Hemolysin III n=1 Tax=Desulfonatronum thiosulfatophilum TaxID=617002 RepID=A0A1G6DYY9_9BACT|nr:hemolysin III family protein [Desulfonatronum thiosulfatophilum]SDB50374.1 hemolysin III [Desulfonatronum thiosulfatophilum]